MIKKIKQHFCQHVFADMKMTSTKDRFENSALNGEPCALIFSNIVTKCCVKCDKVIVEERTFKYYLNDSEKETLRRFFLRRIHKVPNDELNN